MENFYYQVIHNLLRAPTDHATKATTLKHMKTKITRYHHEEPKRLFLNNRERIDDENPSLYHLVRAEAARDKNGPDNTRPQWRHSHNDGRHKAHFQGLYANVIRHQSGGR